MIAEMVGQMTGTIRYVETVRYGSATGLTAELYQQMKADFMVGPVMTLHSPLPEVMAGAWSILRETLLAGRVDRAIKEAVAAAVSKKNQCPFCVDAHTLMLRATGKHDVADAILRGDYDNIHDRQLRSLFQWATADQITDPNQPSLSAFGRGDAA
jgi:AhpD family alkylhydroperoxidase